MTLVLALPATDGVALVSDTRKWLRSGSYIDGHRKLIASRDGFVTGTGSGQLLDRVAEEVPHRGFTGVVALIADVAGSGVWEAEIADWTLTAERQPVGDAAGENGVGIVVFDGFSFKRTRWKAGSVPAGLPPQYLARAHAQVSPVFDGKLDLDEVRTIAFDVCSDLYRSGLISQVFDLGTHRPGNRLNIERLRVPGCVLEARLLDECSTRLPAPARRERPSARVGP